LKGAKLDFFSFFFRPLIRLPHVQPFYVAAATIAIASATVAIVITPGQPAKINWAMTERTGIDRNHNGIVDLPYDYTYSGLEESSWPHQLIADSYYPVPRDDKFEVRFATWPIGYRYHWTIQECPVDPCAEGASAIAESSMPEFKVDLHQRRYLAHVTFEPHNWWAFHYEASVVVEPKDIVWVAMGDSFSAGEGNPRDNALSDLG
jgi:hypothetical protein